MMPTIDIYDSSDDRVQGRTLGVGLSLQLWDFSS